jgi:Protein O-mannosyl-transferase TMEM260-like
MGSLGPRVWDTDARTGVALPSVGHAPSNSLARWPAVAAGVCALVLYALCLSPGLTWSHDGADGGDLLAAALTQGVPHPSGYPTHQLLLRAAIALFPGEPARAGNWLSAVCAAGAAALLADMAMRMLPARPWRAFVALAAALTWAASPTLWGQAVITEVYTLNALLVVVLLWLLWRWREKAPAHHAGWPWLAGAGFVVGIGLGNHLSIVLALPGIAAWLWTNRSVLKPLRAPGWMAIIGATVLGSSVYLYLPLAAVGTPPVNWGDPRTLQGFWWLVSGQVYRNLVFALGARDLLARVAAWAGESSRQFGAGPWGALIALAGLFWLDRHDHAWWRATLLVGLAYSLYAIGYNSRDSYVYLIPVWSVAALWLAAGLFWGAEAVTNAGLSRRALRLLWIPLLFVIIGLPAFSLVRHWGRMDLSHDREARDWVAGALGSADPGGVILSAGDRTTFALWYALYGLKLRPDLTPVNVNLYAYPWYQRALVNHHSTLASKAHDGELPPLEQFVNEVSRERPVYLAEPMDLDFAIGPERPVGTLVRIEPK